MKRLWSHTDVLCALKLLHISNHYLPSSQERCCGFAENAWRKRKLVMARVVPEADNFMMFLKLFTTQGILRYWKLWHKLIQSNFCANSFTGSKTKLFIFKYLTYYSASDKTGAIAIKGNLRADLNIKQFQPAWHFSEWYKSPNNLVVTKSSNWNFQIHSPSTCKDVKLPKINGWNLTFNMPSWK